MDPNLTSNNQQIPQTQLNRGSTSQTETPAANLPRQPANPPDQTPLSQNPDQIMSTDPNTKSNPVNIKTKYIPTPASDQLKYQLLKAVKTLTSIGLTIYGLYGIVTSIKFIFVDYRQLEILLGNHQISETQINGFAFKAIVNLVVTIINMVMAGVLVKSKTTKIIEIVLGIAIFLSSLFLGNYFAQRYDITHLITNPIINTIEQGREIERTIEKGIISIPSEL